MSVSYPQTQVSKSSDDYIDTTKTSTAGGENVESFSRKVISRLEQILTWFNGLSTVATSGSYNDLLNKPTPTAGSSTLPVYFASGTPTACSTTLGVSITGNAATATTITTDADASTKGIAKLYTETGSNTDGAVTQAAITTALAGKLGNTASDITTALGNTAVAVATKATQDASGNVITTTYATKSEVCNYVYQSCTAVVTGGDGDWVSFTITAPGSSDDSVFIAAHANCMTNHNYRAYGTASSIVPGGATFSFGSQHLADNTAVTSDTAYCLIFYLIIQE